MTAPELTVRLDAQAIQSIMTSARGPVFRHQMVVGDKVKQGARQQVGVSRPAERSTRAGGSQHLRDAIVKRPVAGRGGPEVHVVAPLPHAVHHHEGTPAHIILPRRARMLRFTVGGQVVFARQVSHPGTKPNRFLTDPAKRLGLKVTLATIRRAR